MTTAHAAYAHEAATRTKKAWATAEAEMKQRWQVYASTKAKSRFYRAKKEYATFSFRTATCNAYTAKM